MGHDVMQYIDERVYFVQVKGSYNLGEKKFNQTNRTRHRNYC